MNGSEPDLKAIKASAKSQFEKVPGVSGFGIGEHTLRIYIESPEVRKGMPRLYQGVPIDYVVTGEVALQRG